MPARYLTFQRLYDAALRDGFEVEQIALRRVIFRKRYDATWTSRVTFKLCPHRGWVSQFYR